MKNNIAQKETDSQTLTRRDVLLGLGATAAGLAFSQTASAAKRVHDHSQHSPQQEGVLQAANNCSDKGLRCITHCLVAWNEGDLELAACANKVNEMLAVCDGFSKLLAANSKHIRAYAEICKDICKECAHECQKHDKHTECKECGDACQALIKSINRHFS